MSWLLYPGWQLRNEQDDETLFRRDRGEANNVSTDDFHSVTRRRCPSLFLVALDHWRWWKKKKKSTFRPRKNKPWIAIYTTMECLIRAWLLDMMIRICSKQGILLCYFVSLEINESHLRVLNRFMHGHSFTGLQKLLHKILRWESKPNNSQEVGPRYKVEPTKLWSHGIGVCGLATRAIFVQRKLFWSLISNTFT